MRALASQKAVVAAAVYKRAKLRDLHVAQVAEMAFQVLL